MNVGRIFFVLFLCLLYVMEDFSINRDWTTLRTVFSVCAAPPDHKPIMGANGELGML